MATIRKRGDKYHVQFRRQGFAPVTKSFIQHADAKEWARMMETKADRHELAPTRKELTDTTLGELACTTGQSQPALEADRLSLKLMICSASKLISYYIYLNHTSIN